MTSQRDMLMNEIKKLEVAIKDYYQSLNKGLDRLNDRFGELDKTMNDGVDRLETNIEEK
ncbi:hypothetical protein [Alkalihalobacillus sp. LMS39]|uniref:hypothetical protein n=1 Tax=Alkalihalobacillus sp. LMS39 TaxID=2924032 RepID=UPI001FB473DF|nr:hypothetical protein [Alkalihalobacillus sp. LMS39]UOE95114.1 hypothetical protein MM271_05670 [Alkalihalobacillus sp. LMS39]